MRNIAAAWLALLAFIAPPQVTAFGVGDELPALSLKDQYDKTQTLDGTVQRIYANADRKGDALMKEAMAQLDQSHLDQQKAIVVAEISAAPFFVKSIIRGSLKDRKYLTWLDTKGDTKKILPYRDNQIAVIELDHRRIKAVRYVGEAEALKKEIVPGAAEEKK